MPRPSKPWFSPGRVVIRRVKIRRVHESAPAATLARHFEVVIARMIRDHHSIPAAVRTFVSSGEFVAITPRKFTHA